MNAMLSRVAPGERLLAAVETGYGSGDFRIDPRLRVEEVEQSTDRAITSAKLAMRVDEAFDSEEARRRYHPDLRLIVMTESPDALQRKILFDGYAPVQTARWDGRIDHEGEWYVFEAEHVFERLSRNREALILGRRMRSDAIEKGLESDPALYADKSVRVTALPCTFNPEGSGNRAATYARMPMGGSAARAIPLFTWDGDVHGQLWTYADVLRYLVWFYLPREGPVREGDLFAFTDNLTEDTGSAANQLEAALLRRPTSLDCEATSLAEALAFWSAESGVRVSTETRNSDGRIETRLRIWAEQDGAIRHLYLVRGGRHEDGTSRYAAGDKSPEEILADNNVYRGQVSWNNSDIVNSPVVIGDIRQYEITVPLWPGWIPRNNLDNVPVDQRSTARQLALTPDQVRELGDDTQYHFWFRRYHRQGSEFYLDRDTSRYWVLNEDGYFDGTLYNRSAPYDDYRPFDFSTVVEQAQEGNWSRRLRRFLPTISQSADGRPLGVWVEVSFDGGTSWHQQSSSVRVLNDRCGIYFDCRNPTEIAPAGIDPIDQNMWYALIDGTFRVRVTAVIEGDDRLMVEYPAGRTRSATLQVNARPFRRMRDYQFISATGTTNILQSSGLDAQERDDSASAGELARHLADSMQDRRIEAAPVIPWIETGYALGDRIAEIRGRQLRFCTRAGHESGYPAVIGRRFVWREQRYETELKLGTTRPRG